MKITIFTLALNDKNKPNKNIDAPLHQLCINTWDKIIKYAELNGIEAEIKIFTEDSPEYQAVYNECLVNKSTSLRSCKADVFRMYILSKYPNHMWLDWDTYIFDNFEFDFSEEFLMKSWYFIYNCNNLDIFKSIYNTYLKYDMHNFKDKQISEYIEDRYYYRFKTNSAIKSSCIHLSFLDAGIEKPEILHFLKDDEENDPFVLENIHDKWNYRFINVYAEQRHNYIYGLNNEKNIIDFMIHNINLSNEQLQKLNSILKMEDV